MSIFTVKMIACVAMAASHVGSVFKNFMPLALAQSLFLVGRISFPIFAYLLVGGWNHTSHKKRYLKNLLLFAILSQIPFTLAHYSTVAPVSLNVLFTLFLGALSLWAIDRIRQGSIIALFLAPLPVCLAACISLDFGWPGVLVISVMGLARSKYFRMCILTAGMAIIYFGGEFALFPLLCFLCTLPGIAMLFFLDMRKPCVRAKYFFYFFYPVHLFLLYIISYELLK